MISINEDRLIKDLYYTRYLFVQGTSKNIIKKDYSSFYLLNRVLANTYHKMISEKNIFRNPNEISNMLAIKNYKEINKLLDFNDKESSIIIESIKNYDKFLDEIDFKDIPYYEVIRSYSEKDFKDILLSYFNTFGDKYYNIAKKYFDEGRIHMGYSQLDGKGNAAGFFANLTWIYAGYIISMYKDYNTWSLVSIAHELGHAVDAETFLFPQQKYLPTFADVFIEVPSTTFELGLLDYLKNNKIDVTGSLIHYNDRFMLLKNYSNIFKKLENDSIDYYLNTDGELVTTNTFVIKKEDAIIDEDGQIQLKTDGEVSRRAYYNEDGDIVVEKDYVYQYRDAILYSIGYYTALNLNEIKKEDISEFKKILNNIITLRKESSYENMIDMMGLSKEEYISGNKIKNTINDNTQLLKKRFNAYY